MNSRHVLKCFHTIFILGIQFPCSAQEPELTPKILYEIKGSKPELGRQFGVGVWGLRDVNGDHQEDLLITGLKPVGYEVGNAGVYSGRDGRHLYEVEYDPPTRSSFAALDTNFARLGDVDGDHIPDFLAGDSTEDGKGVAIVFSGKTGFIIRTHRGIIQDANCGRAVYSLGDLDSDSVGDYGILSQVGRMDLPTLSTIITVYSGKSGSELASIVHTDGAGLSLAAIADIDDDGTPDLALAHDQSRIIEFISGRLRGVILVGAVPVDITLKRFVYDNSFVFSASASNGSVGLATVSDLDGDGSLEILARGSIPSNPYVASGLIAISPVKCEEAWTTPKTTNPHSNNYNHFAKIGDINTDGVTDLAALFHRRAVSNKEVGLLSGADGSVLFSFQVPDNSELTSISDLDGDGICEIAISDRYWDNNTGRVIIYSIGPASQDPAPYRPGNPQLTVHATPEEVTIAWPATVENPQPEWSPDLQTWQPVFEGTAPESGRFVLPGTEAEPQRYFRLQYEE